MDKYQCGPCGYIYDPEVGDPDGGIAPGTLMIGYAQFAVSPRICSKKYKRS